MLITLQRAKLLELQERQVVVRLPAGILGQQVVVRLPAEILGLLGRLAPAKVEKELARQPQP
jgi:hypothetical protein